MVLEVYRLSRGFPPSEVYGLTSQRRRAAASVAANVAEGAGKNTRGDLARHCRIALGSANELDYHLLLARDLGYRPESDYGPSAADVARLRRMLSRFIDRLDPPDR